MDWFQAIGRFHPLLLHLPIGIFIALAWLELWSRFKGHKESTGAGRSALVCLLVLCAPLAATTGWLLHEGAHYPYPIELHEWFGIGLMTVALLIGWAHHKQSVHYSKLLWLGCLILLPTAHLGSTLTHGENFLIEPWLATDQVDLPDSAAQQLSYEDLKPLFEARCLNCHSEQKRRGGLSVQSLEALARGGESGPAIVFGNLEQSLLMQRLRLPVDHDDHMPPSGKPQPSQAELHAIEAWITGAPAVAPAVDLNLSELQPPKPAAETRVPEKARATPAHNPESLRAIEVLRANLAHVQPQSENSPLLWIDFAATNLQPGQIGPWLAPLRDLVVDLSAAGHSLNEQDLQALASMPKLELLDLRRLSQPALDLSPLAASQSLRSLNLVGTAVAPDSLPSLVQIKSLERVFLWDTGVEDQIPGLVAARPDLVVIAASPAPDEALEVEPAIVFATPGAEDAGGALHSTCPVTGKGTDERFVILYEGASIAFCCSNCPKTFWNDPSSYLSDPDQR